MFTRRRKTDDAAPATAPSHNVTVRRRRLSKRLAVISFVTCFVLVGGGLTYWWFLVRQPAVVNPFSASVLAAAQTPLYYPTQLPNGYRIDTKSVTAPQAGVTVLTLAGPKNQQIYMSEEARPTKYDIGGFYTKFTDLKEVVVSEGSIASGLINNNQTKIASRLYDKTWVLTNTNDPGVSAAQLAAMLKSMKLSY
ncbi:MAG TPA: hypothetical protein VIM53_03610 [Candidatus Saccharimonadales bacterium]